MDIELDRGVARPNALHGLVVVSSAQADHSSASSDFGALTGDTSAEPGGSESAQGRTLLTPAVQRVLEWHRRHLRE